ncbi:hypothetical protein WJT74_01625 [Sphingomicrobium sp. XHP0239]|uniref:hypothetical protein n=1 Tax=Sphingomicrobium maritimum TaxID=3133972 RepID=UPI0031CCAF35
MLKRIARLFTIKTRFEAALVTYAIASGAVVRGFLFLQQYPGWLGIAMAVACLGVVFVAGAKLFDAVRTRQPAIAQGPWRVPARHYRGAELRSRRRRRASDRRPRLGGGKEAVHR